LTRVRRGRCSGGTRPAASISITTKAPSHSFGGSAAVSYGNYQTAEASTYVTGGLTDNLAADLAVYVSNQGEGYGRNLYTGDEIQKNQDPGRPFQVGCSRRAMSTR